MSDHTVCVIGLGYVGIPLVHSILSNTKLTVVGYDTSQEKIDSLSQGNLPDSLLKYSSIFNDTSRFSFFSSLNNFSLKCDVYIICVPTPLKSDGSPDITYVSSAYKFISTQSYAGSLISLESTVYPGCTEYLSSLYFNETCDLCFSPEREDPGNPKYTITNIPKLVSGNSKSALNRSVKFYSSFIETVIPVSSIKVAECSKLIENTQRAVNISLMNELKQYTNYLGVDIFEIIDAASTKPFGFTRYTPGPGIGGHCIPIDPSYLSWAGKKDGYHLDFIEQSTKVNANLPKWILNEVLSNLSLNKVNISSLTAVFIGTSYKPNIDDDRSSPSIAIVRALSPYFNKFLVYDPYCTSEDWPIHNDFPDLSKLNDVVSFILTDHDCVDYDYVRDHSVFIFDSRGRFNPLKSSNVYRI